MSISTEAERQADYDASVRETIDGIESRLGVSGEKAERLWDAMCAVYELMGDDGLCDSAGGCESMRVIPEALVYIRYEANARPASPTFSEMQAAWSELHGRR
jgi:hypothetical protein